MRRQAELPASDMLGRTQDRDLFAWALDWSSRGLCRLRSSNRRRSASQMFIDFERDWTFAARFGARGADVAASDLLQV